MCLTFFFFFFWQIYEQLFLVHPFLFYRNIKNTLVICALKSESLAHIAVASAAGDRKSSIPVSLSEEQESWESTLKLATSSPVEAHVQMWGFKVSMESQGHVETLPQCFHPYFHHRVQKQSSIPGQTGTLIQGLFYTLRNCFTWLRTEPERVTPHSSHSLTKEPHSINGEIFRFSH